MRSACDKCTLLFVCSTVFLLSVMNNVDTQASAFVMKPQQQKGMIFPGSGSSSTLSRRTNNANNNSVLSAMLQNNYHVDENKKSKRMMGAKTAAEKVTKSKVASMLFGIGMAITTSMALPPLVPQVTNAYADSGPRVVGQIKGSGLVFKDTLQIESFDDPKVKGVTLYISTFQRPLTERLTSSFLTEPSDASVGCAKTGPIQIADNIAEGTVGEEVFQESKSLLFKSLRVQRIFDKEKNTVLYVSFNTRLDKNDDTNKSRFKSSICAVNLD